MIDLQSELTRLRTTIEAQSVTLQDSSAALAVATKERDVATEALRDAESGFDQVRLGLVKELDEPLRRVFWLAVASRDKARAALNASAATQETDP